MVATSSMDGESVALLRDYANELLQCVFTNSRTLPLSRQLTITAQVDGQGAAPDIRARVREREHRVPEHLSLVMHEGGLTTCPDSTQSA